MHKFLIIPKGDGDINTEYFPRASKMEYFRPSWIWSVTRASACSFIAGVHKLREMWENESIYASRDPGSLSRGSIAAARAGSFVVTSPSSSSTSPFFRPRVCAVMSYIRPSLRVFVNRQRERRRCGDGGRVRRRTRDEERRERRTQGRNKKKCQGIFCQDWIQNGVGPFFLAFRL